MSKKAEPKKICNDCSQTIPDAGYELINQSTRKRYVVCDRCYQDTLRRESRVAQPAARGKGF